MAGLERIARKPVLSYSAKPGEASEESLTVVTPKTWLNASAWIPVFAGSAAAAAAWAVAQRSLAAWLAPQVFTNWSHMARVMMLMF